MMTDYMAASQGNGRTSFPDEEGTESDRIRDEAPVGRGRRTSFPDEEGTESHAPGPVEFAPWDVARRSPMRRGLKVTAPRGRGRRRSESHVVPR